MKTPPEFRGSFHLDRKLFLEKVAKATVSSARFRRMIEKTDQSEDLC
jgi:hypothetical protein